MRTIRPTEHAEKVFAGQFPTNHEMIKARMSSIHNQTTGELQVNIILEINQETNFRIIDTECYKAYQEPNLIGGEGRKELEDLIHASNLKAKKMIRKLKEELEEAEQIIQKSIDKQRARREAGYE